MCQSFFKVGKPIKITITSNNEEISANYTFDYNKPLTIYLTEDLLMNGIFTNHDKQQMMT